MMNILIGSDLVPTKSNLASFCSGKVDEVIGEGILELFATSDCSILNLETVLCDTLAPIQKCGPCLAIPTEAVEGLKALNPSVLTMANNHIMDHGEQGLRSTMDCLKSAGIPHFGAGLSLGSMHKHYIVEKDGQQLGFYSCAEHEFSIATEESAGANPYDPLHSFDEVRALRERCDAVIVLYHGGREYYRYPSPQLQKVCRRFCEAGADVVVCQHSHCIGCREQYGNSTIVYGQGNFLFDGCDDEVWQTSLLLRVALEPEGCRVDYIPLVKQQEKVALAAGETAQEILEQFEERSRQILSPVFLRERYREESARAFATYYNAFRKGEKMAMVNYLDCEAHREIFLQGVWDFRPEDWEKKSVFMGKIKRHDGTRDFFLFGMKVYSYKRRKRTP